MKKSLGFLSVVAVLAASLAGCADTSGQQALVPGSSLTIGESGQCASANPAVLASPGTTRALDDLATLTLPGFYSRDASGALVANTEFGSVKQITSQDYSYTLTGKAKWSDGVAVSPADLAVSWLAATDTTPPAADGTLQGFGSSLKLGSLALANKISLTKDSVRLHFSQPIADWQTTLGLSVPAHVLAKLALPYAGLSNQDAIQSVLDFAAGVSNTNRSAIAHAFSSAFSAPADGTQLPSSLLLTSGAYKVKSFAVDRVVLAANPGFEAGPKASVERVTLICFANADELAAAISAKKVDLASPTATTMSNLSQLETKAKDAGFSTKIGDSGKNEIVLLNFAGGSVFDPAASSAKKAAAAVHAFLKFLPRSGIWSQLAGDKSLKKSDSLVFGSADTEYQAAVNQNGSSAYQFQDAESAAEDWQNAKFDRTVKLRVLFDATGPRGQLEYTQLSRLGKLGGFDLENVSSDNPAAVLASGAWDVFITEQGRLAHDLSALSTAVGALTGFQEAAAANIVALNLPKFDGSTSLLDNAVDGKNLDQVLIQSGYGLPLFETSRLVVWSSKLQNYQPTVGNNSVIWGYSNWSVSGKGK